MVHVNRAAAAMAALAVVASGGTATALVSPDGDGKSAALQVAAGQSARTQPRVASQPTAARAVSAWTRFRTERGGTWQSVWDADTHVPLRILGSGIAAPGSMASPAIAEGYARSVLASHIDLLAPGSQPQDFEVVSNHLGGGMRTIGMVQRAGGVRVLGGQVSFRFKNDRLFVIASEALPDVRVAAGVRVQDMATLAGGARAWMSQLSESADAQVTALDGPFVLPVIRSGAHPIEYHYAMRATVTTEAPLGRWHVFVDAATATPVAREQRLRFATGSVRYNVPFRRPTSSRFDAPARNTSIRIGGTTVTTDADGNLTFDGDAPVSITTQVTSPLVNTVNAGGMPITQQFSLAPDDSISWDLRGDEQTDAQLITYIHAHAVKDYARGFAPELEFLDAQLRATVNINDSCNAFSDGETINFFRADDQCENTGRLADVVYHEFGHALHAQSLIEGVGAFDGAFSEGLSDYLAATITNDPGMGRGFFFNGVALRDLDPSDGENRWPEDIGEVHFTGLIFGGAMWDLRTALVAAHGQEAGVALADRLFYAAVQRATSIPTTYVEILAADDDDGDLSNGTPNECAINETFGRHGLRVLRTGSVSLGAQSPDTEEYAVSVAVGGLSAQCPGDAVQSATLQFRLRGEDEFQTVDMDGDDTTFTGVIPRQPENSVVEYQVVLELADGGAFVFPTNLAQPFYEFYIGEVTELYCTDFERDPFADGWTTQTDPASKDEWEWGAPTGTPGGVFPDVAFSGDNILGMDLGPNGDGFYENDMVSAAISPTIDVGNFSDVRLHFRRWLTVEDSLYDRAAIAVNGVEAWRNFGTPSGQIHNLDAEWVFQDVSLSPHIRDGKVTLRFELESDPGLEFGGWHIDDVCVVAQVDSICGDGNLTGAEECDDAGANDDAAANACRTNCRLAACGDGVVDTGERCDDGNLDDDDGCSAVCGVEDAGGCGCSAGVRDPYAASMWLLGLFGLLLANRRRRRR